MAGFSYTDIDARAKNIPPAWRFLWSFPTIKGMRLDPLLVQTCNPSFLHLDFQNVFEAGRWINLPNGAAGVDGFPITFYESENYDVLKYFSAWLEISIDLDSLDDFGGYALPAHVKKQVMVELIDNFGRIGFGMVYEGVQLSRIEPLNLAGNTSELLTITVNFVADGQRPSKTFLSATSIGANPLPNPTLPGIADPSFDLLGVF